jgi:hypothetical protein
MKPKPIRKFVAALTVVCMLAIAAFATPTALSTIVLVQNNVAVTAGQLTLTFTACDNVNGNFFVGTGREVLVVQNADGASAHTFTVSSVADQLGRTDTSLTGYSVAASTTVAVQMKYLAGWLQSGGQNVNVSCNSNQIKFAVLQFN